MKANLCSVERAIRLLVGVALVASGVFLVRGLPGLALGFLGAVLILSGSTGFCHIYKFLRARARK